MLIYEGTKAEFQKDMEMDAIPYLLDEVLHEKMNLNVSAQEKLSWKNSTQYMYKVLNDREIPDNCGIAIEFNIPRTNMRVDFIISGYNENQKKSAIIIELKQWTQVTPLLDYNDIIEPKVETVIGRAVRKVVHPSYQAWSYVDTMNKFLENVEKEKIELFPCAYLHNYDLQLDQGIVNDIYAEYISKSPIFTQGEILKLRDFIKSHLHAGDDKVVLYDIENGRVMPSKYLQDCVLSMMDGNEEYTLLDDQKVIFEEILSLARKCQKDHKKRVLIAKGGPGTGKSVIAINALAKLTSEGLMCHYVTKNAAPRNVYHSKMKKKSQENIRSLFTNADDFYKLTESNCIDVALVDESHRLRELSGVFNNLGENQIKEIINSSLLSVFFIDSFQRVTYRDFGTIDEITKQANSYHALIIEADLFSQFRCNGSDGYISWIRHMLGMEQSANFNFSDIDFDFRVFDSPTELHDMIRQRNDENKKSRLIAGYCWDWPKTGRNDPNILDIKIDDFEMSWNLDNANPFAIDENSIHQVGCIHTVQGLEFDYVGIIIGNDLRYDNGIVTDYKARAKTDKSFFGMKKGLNFDKGRIEEVTREIILNTYYTLMSRGMKGCYVYCCDKGLQNYIKSLIEH